MREFCRERNVTKGYVITKDAVDFGVLSLESGIQALKIPAPLACYWLGQAEREASELLDLEA